MRGSILLISGPSRAGKPTLLEKLFGELKDELCFSISSTTRTPRDGEINEVHYHFINQEEFQNDIKNGDLLEWAGVHENFYGTSLRHTNKTLDEGKIVTFDIGVQGFRIAKESLGDRIDSIFIATKNRGELKKRPPRRNIDTITQLNKRLENVSKEMEELEGYDYLIINDNLEKSYGALRSIFPSLKHKIKRQDIGQTQNLRNKEV